MQCDNINITLGQHSHSTMVLHNLCNLLVLVMQLLIIIIYFCLFHGQADYLTSCTCCVYIPIFNSLWLGCALQWHRSRTTVIQVVACCLTAPGHGPDQCWLIISRDQWQSPGGANFHKKYLIHQSLKLTWKISNPKFHLTLQEASESFLNK